MEIIKTQNDKALNIKLVGRLDTVTAPQLEKEMDSFAGINSLILDLINLEYISSAGLRVLLAFQKLMNKQGKMVIKNVCPEVLEVFEITGFSDILTIE